MAKKILGKVALNPRGQYVVGTTYDKLDVVTNDGSSYLSKVDRNTTPLTNTTNWQLIASKGNTGSAGFLPETVTPSTTASVSDGIYYAQTAGTYSGVVVREGYYTLLRKENGVWSIASEVKMPESSAEGKVEEGNTQAVSGGEVYSITNQLTRQQGTLFTISGYRLRDSGSIGITENESIISDFIDISNSSKIIIKGRSTNVVPLINFYNKDKVFISCVLNQSLNDIETTFLKSDFPTNAFYARFNGKNNTESYVITDTNLEISKIANASFKIASENKDNLNLNLDLSDTLTLNAYWRRDPNTLERKLANSTSHKTSEPFAIEVGDVISYGGSVASTLASQAFNAFLNEDKEVVAPIINTVGQQDIKITQEQWDLGYRYVSFTYRNEDTDKSLRVNRQFNYNRFYQSQDNVKVNKLGNTIGIAGMGASIMSPSNGWFEKGIEILGCIGYNKAVNATHPVDNCNRLWRKTFLTEVEFENTDVLLVQFTNHPTIGSTENLLPTIEDYDGVFDIDNPDNPFSIYTSAQQLDYILKYWQKWCYDQRLNENSKWYNTNCGKPFNVAFVTNWNDGRSTYNAGIRAVAERWGGSVLEFDKKIGFSKSAPLPDGTQVSTLYARNNTTADGVVIGWHPYSITDNEAGKYIQTKMGNLFADLMISNFKMI